MLRSRTPHGTIHQSRQILMSATLRLAEQLISLPSVTPNDGGCTALINSHLEPLGFQCEVIDLGPDNFRVRNLWAKKSGSSGHTLKQWASDPFTPTHRDDKLFGRGASDMKTSLAAMVVATQEFYKECANPALGIAFLLTSDEEGPALDGTVRICEMLHARNETPDYCIVGEPTSVKQTGDMIKNGRRGSLSGHLIVKGIQGHIAYPQLADNPVHRAAPALAELANMVWDTGNEFFPPTSWQISNVQAGTGATNVIPGEMIIDFNFRFCTESNESSLKKRLTDVLLKHALKFDIEWTLGGLPFLTTPGTLVKAVQEAIHEVTGLRTELSTTGGTSDGRFIAQTCPQVIELGPPNATIHKIDEHVALVDIEPLKNIYKKVLFNLNNACAIEMKQKP
jgi:succinyl-diaminopimelate desuccinylase